MTAAIVGLALRHYGVVLEAISDLSSDVEFPNAHDHTLDPVRAQTLLAAMDFPRAASAAVGPAPPSLARCGPWAKCWCLDGRDGVLVTLDVPANSASATLEFRSESGGDKPRQRGR